MTTSVSTKICDECVFECRKKGDCWGGDREFQCGCSGCNCELGPPSECTCLEPCFEYLKERYHQEAEHVMEIDGPVFRCTEGHKAPMTPSESMRNAGIKPMF